MRLDRSLSVVAFAAALLIGVTALDSPARHAFGPSEEEEAGRAPNDWFFLQRAFPFGSIDPAKVEAAFDQARGDRLMAGKSTTLESAPTWQQAGPFNIGGRVTAVTAAPGGATVYIGAAGGGVFKSTNSGTNWTPVFDEIGLYSIGALAMSPADTSTVYVGTGEANSSVDSYDGAGVFRTTDGGDTWSSLGLAATARIARIAVDPSDPQKLFVAAMGTQFSTGPDRGLYRSTDGGTNWSKVLFVSDSTGCSDVVINPAHPETVFCATWERVRRFTYRRAYGPECGIWRSIDGGDTWTKLTGGGLPAPSDSIGRIGLAIAPSQPSRIYAQVMYGENGGYSGRGLFRSLDGGNTWALRGGSLFPGNFGGNPGFGWYFGEVKVAPNNPDLVFMGGVDLLRTTDGGQSSSEVTGSAHVDQHAIWIDPSNPNRVYLGNDGGFFSSQNLGIGWNKSLDLPITQFYAGTVDPSNPDRLLGGAQDNSTVITSGSPTGWTTILGGDGFQCLVSPNNPNLLYAEYQYCCGNTGLWRSTNGGGGWNVPTGFAGSDRYNWNAPICMNPKNANTLLVGSQRVYRSRNAGVSYSAISGDLSTNPVTNLLFGTLTTLAISPADTLVYYAGTDDGKVWRTADGGGLWIDITAGLPTRYITRVTPDPADANVVYVTLSGFGSDEHLAHVYRSADAGASWTSLSANLPDAPANDLVVDPDDTNTMYLATDVGVYATRNGGAGWYPLGAGMPIQTVADLTLYSSGGVRRLIAATHGRSQWTLDLTTLPTGVPPVGPVASLELGAPTPNPSRGAVRLALDLPAAGAIEAAIYDLAGRRVASLAAGAFSAGRHDLRWDGRDAAGRTASAGVYFARVRSRLGTRSRAIVRTN
jgi:photosystem II stability/assembly factor-like uncharacterized protein